MAKILFWPDVYQEQGHWLPAISIAQKLNSLGHIAEFMGIADCEALVTSHSKTGAIGDTDPLVFHKILEEEYPPGYTRNHQHKSINERWKPKHLLPILEGTLDSLFGSWPSANYDLLISGYFASLESLMIHYRYGQKIMVLTTYLRHPQDDPGIRVAQNLIGLSEPVYSQFMKDAVKRTDGSSAIDVSSDFTGVFDLDQFAAPLLQVPEIVPCPLPFEFNKYKPNLGTLPSVGSWTPEQGTVFYTEPCITRSVLASAVQDSPNPDSIGTSDTKIIFASSGSQVQDYENKARNMFRNLIGMMKMPGMSNYHLVLGVGYKLIKEYWAVEDDLPTNVTVKSWVNQEEILRHAKTKAVFLHGGLASIKEVIYHNKALIVLPHGKDQMQNALRIREKQIGTVGHVEDIESGKMRDLLLRSLKDGTVNAKRSSLSATFVEYESDTPSYGSELSNHDFGYNNSNRASILVIEKYINS
jgi:hypothetical protein